MSDSRKVTSPANAQKSTGPITDDGKAIVSQNAVTHGALSQKLIDKAEVASFWAMVEALSHKYPSDNPLVQMQIERIAKIKVQLDRVQSLIDKTFEETELPSAIDEHLMDLLNLDEKQREKLKNLNPTPEISAIDFKKIGVAQDLLKSNALQCETHEELLSKCPSFCENLYNKALSLKTSLNAYVKHLASSPNSYDAIESAMSMKIHKILDTTNNAKELLDMKTAILNVPLSRLLEVASKFISYTATINNTDLKIALYSSLKNKNLISGKINFDALNNLYRYQTTLQKQLSKTIGELLALTAKSQN